MMLPRPPQASAVPSVTSCGMFMACRGRLSVPNQNHQTMMSLGDLHRHAAAKYATRRAARPGARRAAQLHCNAERSADAAAKAAAAELADSTRLHARCRAAPRVYGGVQCPPGCRGAGRSRVHHRQTQGARQPSAKQSLLDALSDSLRRSRSIPAVPVQAFSGTYAVTLGPQRQRCTFSCVCTRCCPHALQRQPTEEVRCKPDIIHDAFLCACSLIAYVISCCGLLCTCCFPLMST